jgi:glycogen debranching enzyme
MYLCNHSHVFNRFRHRLPTDLSKPIQVDLPISHAGAFVYWVEYDSDVHGERIKGRDGYFNIDPILRTKARSPILSSELKPLSPLSGAVVQSDSVNLPLDGLCILTVVSKWMGPLSKWREHFLEASDRGYTMLHWTPLQERGKSDSPYSIRDQLKYDPSLFEEYGLLSLTDVVLNHTANDSPWLVDHPEAGKCFGLSARHFSASYVGKQVSVPQIHPIWLLHWSLIHQ